MPSLLLQCHGIRSSSGVGRRWSPLALLVALPPWYSNSTLHLNAFRGVRAISWFDWPFTPTHKSSKHFSTYIGSVLHKDTILASTCSWVDHQVSRLAHVAMSPYSDSLSLRFRSLRTYTCHIRLTRRLIMQKARRHPIGLRPLVSVWFQVLFTPLLGVLFTFPSQYWFTIGLSGVFSLSRWCCYFRTKFHRLRLTRITII